MWSAGPAWAQLDSSSGLFRSGRSSSTPALNGSRYKIRQPESRKDTAEEDELDERPGTYIASPVPPKGKKKTEAKPETDANSPAKSETPATPAPSAPQNLTSPTAPAPTITPTPAASEPAADAGQTEDATKPTQPVILQVKELFMGGNDQDINEYRRQIHPEDPRANAISINIAPAYYYNGSSSDYSYRRYTSTGPGLGLGMNLWLTPFFGVQSKFFTSVSGSIRSDGSDVPSEVQTFAYGLRFRKHFGYSRKAPQLSFGIDFYDAHNKISSDATTAVGRDSAGLSFAMEGEIPTSNTYAHVFEVDIRPKMHHTEKATGADVESGDKNETNALNLSIGGQWTLDRHNQVYWKTQYSVERNLFDGTASKADPQTGLTPDGVSVTNSLFIFYFGFRWGS